MPDAPHTTREDRIITLRLRDEEMSIPEIADVINVFRRTVYNIFCSRNNRRRYQDRVVLWHMTNHHTDKCCGRPYVGRLLTI